MRNGKGDSREQQDRRVILDMILRRQLGLSCRIDLHIGAPADQTSATGMVPFTCELMISHDEAILLQ